jgi:hypothetical protein
MLPTDSEGYIRRWPRLKEPQQSLIVVNYSNLLLYTHSVMMDSSVYMNHGYFGSRVLPITNYHITSSIARREISPIESSKYPFVSFRVFE